MQKIVLEQNATVFWLDNASEEYSLSLKSGLKII